MTVLDAGLYVHLPYCASRCGYCAFVVTTDGSSRDRYLAAIEREAGLLEEEAAESAFDSVYLGGGTPSLLPGPAVDRLLANLRSRSARSRARRSSTRANSLRTRCQVILAVAGFTGRPSASVIPSSTNSTQSSRQGTPRPVSASFCRNAS